MFSTSFTQTQTIWPSDNMTQILEPDYVPVLKAHTITSYKPNMIGICVISFILGLLLKQLGPQKTRTIRTLLHEMDLLVNYCFNISLRFMPLGMFCWMFSETLKMRVDSFSTVVVQLVHFFSISASAFLILLFIFYPMVYYVITSQNPFTLYRDIVPAILISIGTASSAITLPMTMRCMEDKARLAKPVAQTVLPLGMTIHMNGTALYYPMVALFVAQIKQISIDPFMMIVLW